MEAADLPPLDLISGMAISAFIGVEAPGPGALQLLISAGPTQANLDDNQAGTTDCYHEWGIT